MNDNAGSGPDGGWPSSSRGSAGFEELREAAGIEGATGFDDSVTEASRDRNAA